MKQKSTIKSKAIGKLCRIRPALWVNPALWANNSQIVQKPMAQGTGNPILGNMAIDDIALVVGFHTNHLNNTWVNIVFDGMIGWVFLNNLRRITILSSKP